MVNVVISACSCVVILGEMLYFWGERIDISVVAVAE